MDIEWECIGRGMTTRVGTHVYRICQVEDRYVLSGNASPELPFILGDNLNPIETANIIIENLEAW